MRVCEMDGKTVADLIRAFADVLWPCVALVAIFVARPFVKGLFQRDNIRIKIANTELSVGEATADIGKAVTDIQAKMAKISDDIEVFKNHEIFNSIPISGSVKAGIPPLEMNIEAKIQSKPFRILWVDDVPSNNVFLIERLRGMGHEVDSTISTAEALFKLEKSEYDCIISDISRIENGITNNVAGLQLVEAVRSTGNRIPILIFSNYQIKSLQSQLFAAGANNVTSSGIDVISFVDAWAARARNA